jgi:hypothetical protein
MPIVIHGRAYKPYVEYTIGSYSELVGHFITAAGIEFEYADPLTGDFFQPYEPTIFLMAHNAAITYSGTGVDIHPCILLCNSAR